MLSAPDMSLLLLAAILLPSIWACPEQCKCYYVDQSHTNGLDPKITGHVAACDRIPAGRAKDIIESLPSDLESLMVTHGGLRELNPLCCFEHLIYMDASFNQINTIFAYNSYPKVQHLNLNGNNLTALRKDEFSSFPALRVLKLEHNQINNIDLETFRLFELEELYLSDNKIQTINEHIFRFVPKLQVLKLDGNKLVTIRASNYYFSSGLKTLTLSRNLITNLEADSFGGLLRLETLDLSHNNLSFVPTGALQPVTALKRLNLAANPFEILTEGSFNRINAERIDMSGCWQLRMVLSDSFKDLHSLSFLNLSANPRLEFLSPGAFRRVPKLQVLSVRSCALQTIPLELLSRQNLNKIHAQDNPLHCGCMHNIIIKSSNRFRTKLETETGALRCLVASSSGYADLFAWNSGHCPPEAVLGSSSTVERPLGSALKLYCASRSGDPLTWSLPGNRLLTAVEHVGGRLRVTNEYLGFDFLLSSDSGHYQCAVSQGEQSSNKTVTLQVYTPAIALYIKETGARYVVVAWNATLSITSDQVRFYLVYKQLSTRPVLPRIVQLSTKSHWRIYTVTRLVPDSNYSFCITYKYEWNQTLYETCVEGSTEPSMSIGATLNYTFAAVVVACVCLLCAICCARCVHKKFHIWQEEKYRSRLAQSISGQSFLSSADSLNGAAASVTFENVQLSSSLYEHLGSRRSQATSIRDMAL